MAKVVPTDKVESETLSDVLSPDQDEQDKKAKPKKKFEVLSKEDQRDLMIHLFFCVVLSISVFVDVSETSHWLKWGLWETILIQDYDTDLLPFEEVRTEAQFWEWMELAFVEALLPQEDLTGSEAGPEYWKFFAMKSRLVSPFRFRQLRVQSHNCSGPSENLDKLSGQCFPSFSTSAELTEPFGPNGAWTHDPGTSRDAAYVLGTQARYPGGGYSLISTAERENMTATLELMKTNGWLDKHTRAVFVEWNMWSHRHSSLLLQS